LTPENAIPRGRDRRLRGNGQHGPSERAELLTAPLRPARRNDTDEAGRRTNLKSGEAVAMQQGCVCRQRASAAKVGSEKGRSLDGRKAVSAGRKCGEASGGGGLEHGNCARARDRGGDGEKACRKYPPQTRRAEQDGGC